MQTGPYIAERLMPQIAAAYCSNEAIDFRAFSDEWVLRLTKGGETKWIVGYKFDVNSSAASELAQDKVATFVALDAVGIAALPHYLVRSLPKELIHTHKLHELLHGMPVVAKPLEGTGGRDVIRFDTTDDALEMIKASGEPAWALSPYYDLQAEYRFILLDGEPLLAYEKTQPTLRGTLKLFNLGFGAVAIATPDDVMQQLIPLAKKVMKATALRLAAVDIVRLPDGSYLVLEVNDGISMEHYARQSADNKKRAVIVYNAIIAAMFR